MEHSPHDAGAQFVLDNRKLIVGFALLIVLCGTFFVIGFMEGKRQGIQRAKEQSPVNAAAPSQGSLPAAMPEGSVGASTKGLEEKSVREQLEWYKSVNKREESPSATPSRSAKAAEPPSRTEDDEGGSAPGKAKRGSSVAKTQVAPKPRPAASSSMVTYSVQVGAFRQRHEAEAKAAALRDRNYAYVIEPTGGTEPLFLLKVGRYESRAEAVATQLRLKKDGFSTFIKTNP